MKGQTILALIELRGANPTLCRAVRVRGLLDVPEPMDATECQGLAEDVDTAADNLTAVQEWFTLPDGIARRLRGHGHQRAEAKGHGHAMGQG